jgi:NAD(P)H-hydrate epimerase
MQSLKEFVIYTKKNLSVKDTYALRANSAALGIAREAFVEVAGFALAEEVKRNHKSENIAIICGRGDKGAAGLATARHLMATTSVSVFFVGDPSTITNGSTKLNYKLVSDIVRIKDINEGNVQQLAKELGKSDIVIDAIIGCGMRGRLPSLLQNVITIINKSGKHIIAIDIPSGIDGDTGMPNKVYVKAQHTFTAHKMKQGIDKSKFVGDTTTVDIGIPINAELFTGPGDVMLATEPRMMQANKYTHGRILVVGGSKDFHGAPLIAAFAADNAMSALLTGAGYATIAVPSQVADPIRKLSAELIVKPLDWDNVEATVAALAVLKHDTLIIGPGLEQSESTDIIVSGMLKSEKGKGNTVIIDADATRVISKHKDLLGKNMILTPHDGEFRGLTGISLKDAELEDRIKKAIGFAKLQGCTLVLKGHETIITNGDLLKINRAETPALATMGTGDALAGMIAAYAATHKNTFESAAAAVYAHSRIGDMLYAKKGLHITASDVLAGIPDVLKQFDTLRI